MKTKLSLLLLGLVVAGLIPFTENIRAAAPGQGAVAPTQSLPSVWPEPYTVQRNRREGTLALSVP